MNKKIIGLLIVMTAGSLQIAMSAVTNEQLGIELRIIRAIGEQNQAFNSTLLHYAHQQQIHILALMKKLETNESLKKEIRGFTARTAETLKVVKELNKNADALIKLPSSLTVSHSSYRGRKMLKRKHRA